MRLLRTILLGLRSILFWFHLIAGVTASAVILLMSVTGVLLTYERQLIARSDSHYRSTVPATGAARLPVETVLETLRREHPTVKPSRLTTGSLPDAPLKISAGEQTLYADAYTGRVLGEASKGTRKFMSEVRDWHRWLNVEGAGFATARAITGWSNVIFLFIVISGLYLWFPRTWTWPQFRNVLMFRRGLTWKAQDFNWHNVIGIWSLIPLFLVVLTALPISFPWATTALYRAVGENPPAGRGGGGGGRGGGRGGDATWSSVGLNALWARAATQVEGWRTIELRVPATDAAPVTFGIDRGDGGQPQRRSTLTLERGSAAVVKYEAFTDLTLGQRLRGIARFGHTGEVLGLPGQTVAGLVSAGAVVLVWTGLALSYRRFRAWLGRRRRPAVPRASSSAA